jgi:hypothetical protein
VKVLQTVILLESNWNQYTSGIQCQVNWYSKSAKNTLCLKKYRRIIIRQMYLSLSIYPFYFKWFGVCLHICYHNIPKMCKHYFWLKPFRRAYYHNFHKQLLYSVLMYNDFIFVTFVSFKIETSKVTQVCILMCITTGMSFIILTKPVSRWWPFNNCYISIGFYDIWHQRF